MEEKTGLKIQVGNAEIEHSGELIPILINQTVLEQKKPLQLVGQAADFKFESNLQPKQAIRQSLPKAIRDNLWTALRHSLGWSVGWAQTKGMCYHSCDTESIITDFIPELKGFNSW